MPDHPHQTEIDRVNAVSQIARTNWFALLAYLLFVGVTLLGVEDADFFIPARETQLPLVGVQIPTLSFFFTAPILGAALYIYLHIHLVRLWEVMAELRKGMWKSDPGKTTILPWLVNTLFNTWGRKHLRGPLGWLSNLVTILLVWLAGPFVLLMFWYWSWGALNELLTLLIAACVIASTYAGLTSWWKFKDTLAETKTGTWTEGGIGIAALGALMFLAHSWHVTEGDLGRYLNPSAPTAENARARLARPDLAGVEFIPKPYDWRDPEVARRAYRTEWCKAEGLPADVCGRLYSADDPQPEHIRPNRLAWCADNFETADPENRRCDAHFAKLDDDFRADWTTERASIRGALPRFSLAGQDLRGADLSNTFLVDATLAGARMEGADLSGARMEGANLRDARMEGADLSGARMEGANLRDARMEGADLSGARMEGANLR
ncbi:MAG: pentapeptide repeat-containing protein, partial [Pseudomonadota bacterium]